MKTLEELYPGCGYDTVIRDIKINSRDCGPGDLFVCIRGASADRHDFIPDAVSRGASALVTAIRVDCGVPAIVVEDPNRELSEVAKRLFDHPERDLKLFAVTGTNGKTTVAQMISQIAGEERCGRLGTNGLACASFSEEIRNTSPDADRLYRYFRRIRETGCRWLCMEASSEALSAGRLQGLVFDTVIFTNITRDHLNTHKTVENYVAAKLKLLELTGPESTAVLNTDDAWFPLVKKTARCRTVTYGTAPEADLRLADHTLCGFSGSRFVWEWQGAVYEGFCPLPGRFNLYNLTAAGAALLQAGMTPEEVLAGAARIRPVPGRAECLDLGQPFDIVLDYAHTPDALSKILGLAAEVKTARRAAGIPCRILTVTGSAGGRDRGKRPEMGRVVLEESDLVFFTMDDPRFERVEDIIDDLLDKTERTNYRRIPDRGEAVAAAFREAGPGDIVLLAGRGRDTHMAIGDRYVPMPEYDLVLAGLERLRTKR